MSEKLLLPQEDVPRKPVWRTWKGICLAAYVLTLLLGRWLPGIVVAICYLAGVIAIANLLFHLLRYLRNRIFWRVRYRIVGSFIFVGLIPLLLVFGIVGLSAYMLMGQLSTHYLETSLSNLRQEVTNVNVELARHLRSSSSEIEFRTAVESELKMHRDRFPRLAAMLLRKSPNGSLEVVHRQDPAGIVADPSLSARERWLADQSDFEGFLRLKTEALLTSLRPVPMAPDTYLEISVPFDRHIEDRLQKEKGIYLSISGIGETNVEQDRKGIVVRVNEKGMKGGEDDLSSAFAELDARRGSDKRRTISWGMVPECRDYYTGEKGPLGFAFFHVSYQTLYNAYLVSAGTYDFGRYLGKAILMLGGIFVVAELVSWLIGFTISRRITRSVHDMYLGTLALQKGDLQYKIPVRRRDQLGLLAHSFNQMSSSMARMLEEVSEKKRLEQELEIAREVQATLFPKQLPHPRGLSLFGGCEPARVVSGDYYDFIHEDDARLHIVVGDISGKGISAALLMANLQAGMRNQISTFRISDPQEAERALSEVMRQLNSQIFLNSPTEKYATLFAGRYDAESRCLCYCNAGHLPPILLSGGTTKRLEAGGTVLGLFPAAAFEARSIELSPGAILAIFTDGVTEAVNHADEEFGEDRLVESLLEAQTRSPEAIYQHVTAQVRLWQGDLRQHDDITLIIGKLE